MISREADIFTIRDMDSRNGLMVNGLPVKERVLEHGDQVEIGDSLFLFLMREEDIEAPSSVTNMQGLVFQSTTRLRAQEALYLKPEKLLAGSPREKSVARDLQILLKISSVLHAAQDRESLQRRLLELIFEYIPADSGAVVVREESSGELISLCAWDRKAGPVQQISVSGDVIKESLRDGISILCNDIENPAEDSVSSSPTVSLLCAPMIAFEKLGGVTYLSTNDQQIVFDEGHLQLLTGIAGIAAVASKNVEQKENLREENRRLQTEFGAEYHIIGESERMRNVYQMIEKLAPSDSTVLLCGESGTGKELVARALHLKGQRASKPFVAINCAALAESLLQSELFGHEKGAFTGAVARKKGKLEIADGGTVFLDEVSEIAPALQAKLLRVLQEREFERVGGNDPIRVNIRVIAATNRNLEEAIKQGAFRQDLYFPVSAAYGTDPELVRRILLEVAENHPGVLKEKKADVLLDQFGESSLNFILRVWTRTYTSKPGVLRSELNYEIAKKFDEHGIEIPFPQREVFVRGGELSVHRSEIKDKISSLK